MAWLQRALRKKVRCKRVDFKFAEEQRLLVNMVDDLAEKEFRPLASRWDENEEFPWPNVKKLAELGLLGISIPEEYGGGGRGVVDVVLVVEHIAQHCFNTAGILTLHCGTCSRAITHFGGEELKRRFLPSMANGEKLAAYAQTEPDAGSDVGNLKTRAILDGNHYIINGTKIFISNSHEAHIFVVMLRFGDTPGTKGVGALVVEKDTPGFSVSKKEHKLGFKGTSISEVVFENARVPKENILIEPGNFGKMMQAFNAERCGNAALSLGVAQGAFNEALRYSEERSQFGQTISGFQGIRWMLADMATKIEAGRLLLYRAATNAEKGLPNLTETAMAKVFCNEMAIEVVNHALQIHGGYGYMREYPVERMYRDVRFPALGGGTVQIQKNLIAAELLKGSKVRF